MAERTIITCDDCGEPAVTSLIIKDGQRVLRKDVCSNHRTVMLAGARTPGRGRRIGEFVGGRTDEMTPRRRGRTPKSRARATPKRRATARGKRTAQLPQRRRRAA